MASDDVKLTVYNMALAYLGEKPLNSLTDDTKASTLLNTIFDLIRDDVLREHPWNFAITRVALTLSVTTPAWGYARQFGLPSDCLKVLGTDYSDIDYRIEGAYLLTDESSINLKYVSQVTDLTAWDVKALTMLAMRLAAEIAFNLTASSSREEAMLKMYLMRLSTAKSIDGQEDAGSELEVNAWLDARL